MKNENAKIWVVALGYWVIFGILCTVLYPVVMSDVITRYAPMAEYFATGDFKMAFHPRFGVIFQVLSGALVWATGMGGDKATQIVAIGFVALSAVPIFYLMKKLFDIRIAWWSVALLLICDHCTDLGMAGFRDSGKCLALALLAYGAVMNRPFWYGVGLFILCTLVSYGFAAAGFLLLLWWVYCLLTDWRLVLRLISPTIMFLLGTLAVTYMTHCYTGHWLPTSNFIKVFGGWL